MKALIKYLPVQVRIKKPRQPIGDLVAEKFLKDAVLGKPFVATLDIKKGDEVLYYNPKINTGVKCKFLRKRKDELNEVEIDGQIKFVETNLTYKILGEVSPEATFIEEGKEYEIPSRHDWECKKQYDCVSGVPCVKCKDPQYIIKVECPCCGDFK